MSPFQNEQLIQDDIRTKAAMRIPLNSSNAVLDSTTIPHVHRFSMWPSSFDRHNQEATAPIDHPLLNHKH
jgi:hypothetical protein